MVEFMTLPIAMEVNNATTLYIPITVIALTTIYYFLKIRSLPPGPIGLPYLGFWPFWSRESSHLHLHELGKKYGDIFSLTITGRLYIILGSYKALREAHISKSDYFSDRAENFTLIGMFFKEGVLCLNGEPWKIIRKFFNQQFRERGLNSLKNEMCGESMYETINGTIEDLRKSKGEPVELINMLTDKCTKVLHSTVFGETGITLKEIRLLNDEYCKILEVVSGRTFLLCGNVARYLILPFMSTYRKANKSFNVIKILLKEIIDHHRATFDEGNIRNIIDTYFMEKKNKLKKNDSTAKYFTEDALMSTLIQVIGDGVSSVAALIGSFIQALLDHPEEQDKIYRELIEVLGSDKDPTVEDKSKLPYTCAFIAEVLRTCEALPFFPKMECTREVNVRGYRIPKGAITVMNIWSCHYDSNEYEEAEKFNPLRFLPSEGKKKPEQPVLFGVGKRACIGEGFVMSQIFLFVTTIVKHFHLSKPKNSKDDALVFLVGNLHVCAHSRTL